MIGMQYKCSNLQAKEVVGVAGGGVGSSIFEANFKKDGNFANIEPISVLETWSPSPSTSTSTLPSFNNTNPTVNVDVSERSGANVTISAFCGGEKRDHLLHSQPVCDAGVVFGHGHTEKLNLGFEGWTNLSESGGCQNEMLYQAGNQNEAQDSMGFVGVDGCFAGNDFSGYNTASSFGVSETGFSLSGAEGITGLDSSGYVLACSFPETNFGHYESLDHKFESANYPHTAALQPAISQNGENVNSMNFRPLFFWGQHEQGNQFQSRVNNQNLGIGCTNLSSQNLNVGLELLPVKQQHSPPTLHHLSSLGDRSDSLLSQSFEKNPPKNEIVGAWIDQMCTKNNQHLSAYEQLCTAAELIMAGNFSNAQGILARLNHLLSPLAKPFQRSALYVKEALQLALTVPNSATSIPPKTRTPLDGMFRMGAYKVFSEVSPVIQFMNFTANQALLEALDGADQIHIIDFDIGFGAHWSSFLKELSRKNGRTISVKITGFAPCTHNSMEISFMHENLTQFARFLGVNFELEVLNINSFNPSSSFATSLRSSESEAIAVNFPVWSFTGCLSALPSYLSLVKKLSPKILVSMDHGCERVDLPFSHHILHILQYYDALLDSIDATNIAPDSAQKIEKFLFQPRIETTILSRLLYPSPMQPWGNLLATVGFVPTSLSNFSEIQAECLVKHTQTRGFHVERRQASLVLYWKRYKLMSVSAWIC